VSDIAIKDGKIARIGGLKGKTAERSLDAAGRIVAPGFVDLHTHYDAQIFWDPYCTLSGWHGVTSVALGTCGFGFAPSRVEDRDRWVPRQWLASGWRSPSQSVASSLSPGTARC
jgi:N-acyl-D-aspartate/D-glutamate deacylase